MSPGGELRQNAHTQIVGLGHVPPHLRTLDRRASDWDARHGSCLLCDLPGLEPEWDAMEVWIVPREQRPELGAATVGELHALAGLPGRVLAALRDHGGDPAYNLLIHSAPEDAGTESARHWFLRIRPRAAQLAGFELATDVHLVPSRPADDAARLRGHAG